VSVANFTESRGCIPEVSGVPKPKTVRSGYLDAGEVIYGPWGDLIGRTKAQVQGSLVNWRIWGTNRTVPIHERAYPAARTVDKNLAAASASGLGYYMSSASSWVWRTVSGTYRFSQHAFGTAIDINGPANPYRSSNVLITNMPDWYVNAWIGAGFCWGGDWVDVKDPMHFSWLGPALTPGYPGRPAPYRPITQDVAFDRIGFTGISPLGDVAGAQFGLADFSGDGSADLYRLTPTDFGARLEAAGSQSGFTVVGLRADLPIDASKPLLVGDRDYDGRPDLWSVDTSGATVALEVRDSNTDWEVAETLATAVPVAAGDDYALALYDDDYVLDLMVIHRSGATDADVWSGASGYGSKVATVATGAGNTSDPNAWSVLVGDFDVDGIGDVYAVEKGVTKVWVGTATGQQTQIAGQKAIPNGAEVLISDYDGDGRDDLYLRQGAELIILLGGSRNPSAANFEWFIPSKPIPWDAGPECVGPEPCASFGYVDTKGSWVLSDTPASAADESEFFFGNPGDLPFAGDWDCDGVETPGLYRQWDGFVYLRNSNTQGVADNEFFFGNPGDVPLIGDFNGDGCDTVSIFRPAEHRFYIINRLGEGTAGLGEADFSFTFGNPGDKAFAGDFNGDGVDDIGLHRESTGLMYMRYSLSAGAADHTFVYGDPGDRVRAADWDGNGVDTVAVYRPGSGNWYIKLANASGGADHAVHFHNHGSTTRPVAGLFSTSSD
jgi:hypothetical protein